jgi:hypothetical protein
VIDALTDTSYSQLDPNDTDYASSGYDTGSTSLSSTVNEYVFENGTYMMSHLAILPKTKADMQFKGRRYHAYYGMDKNLCPTDEVHFLAPSQGRVETG